MAPSNSRRARPACTAHQKVCTRGLVGVGKRGDGRRERALGKSSQYRAERRRRTTTSSPQAPGTCAQGSVRRVAASSSGLAAAPRVSKPGPRAAHQQVAGVHVRSRSGPRPRVCRDSYIVSHRSGKSSPEIVIRMSFPRPGRSAPPTDFEAVSTHRFHRGAGLFWGHEERIGKTDRPDRGDDTASASSAVGPRSGS